MKLKRRFEKISEKGVTIIEMLIYTSLLIVLITALGSIFASILDTQSQSQSSSSVDLDGQYIFAKLIYDMESMNTQPPVNDTIITPAAPGATSTSLTFTVNSVNYTYSLNNGNLQLANDKGTNMLNGTNTTVSGLQFTRIGSGVSTDTIQVSFTLTSKVQRNSGPETRTFQTTVSTR